MFRGGRAAFNIAYRFKVLGLVRTTIWSTNSWRHRSGFAHECLEDEV